MNEEQELKSIFVVASCDDRIHEDEHRKYLNSHRAWSFWDTQEKAIEEGIFGWSGCESLWESGYYTHIVVENITLNRPLPGYYESIQVWFKFVPEEARKENEDIRKSIVRCECPERFKNVIGFY